MLHPCQLAALLLLSFSVSTAVASAPQSALTYDQDRSTLTQVYDGLTLQFRILASQRVNTDERFLFTRDFMLLQVVESLISTIHMQKTLAEVDSVDTVATRVVLGSVIEDSCAYLTSKLSLWYTNFTCSESQLLDVKHRINLFQAVDSARKLVIKVARQQEVDFEQAASFQCDYWNSHVLRNCSIGGGESSEDEEVVGSGVTALHSDPAGSIVDNLEWVEENILKAEPGISSCQLCLTSS